jgi:hypothetical protein
MVVGLMTEGRHIEVETCKRTNGCEEKGRGRCSGMQSVFGQHII